MTVRYWGPALRVIPLVTKSIVNQAAHEVKDSAQNRYGLGLGRLAVIAAALMLAVAGGWMTRSWLTGVPVATSSVPAFLARWLPSRQAELSTTPETARERASGLAVAKPETGGPGGPGEDLMLADLAMDRASAMRVLLRRWGVELADLGPGDPCIRLRPSARVLLTRRWTRQYAGFRSGRALQSTALPIPRRLFGSTMPWGCRRSPNSSRSPERHVLYPGSIEEVPARA